MADDRADPSEQIPEADLLEQQTPVDQPTVDADEAPADRDLGPDDQSGSVSDLVDEADRLEQATPVSGSDEDDYPHG